MTDVCNCPECGDAVESYEFKAFTVLSCDMFYGVPVPGTERRVHVPQGEPEWTLWPCGHRVYTFTIQRTEASA